MLACARLLSPLSTWSSHRMWSSSAPSKPGEATSLYAVLLGEVVTTKSIVLSQIEIEAEGVSAMLRLTAGLQASR